MLTFKTTDGTCWFEIDEPIPETAKTNHPQLADPKVTYRICSDYTWRGQRHQSKNPYEVLTLWEVASHMSALINWENWSEDALDFIRQWDKPHDPPNHIRVRRHAAGYYRDEDE